MCLGHVLQSIKISVSAGDFSIIPPLVSSMQPPRPLSKVPNPVFLGIQDITLFVLYGTTPIKMFADLCMFAHFQYTEQHLINYIHVKVVHH